MNKRKYAELVSRAFAHACFRNGKVEDIHSDPSKNLLDSDMKILNKDVHNRLYTMFLLLTDESDRGQEIYDGIISWNNIYGKNWDRPEIEKRLLTDEEYDFVRQLEKDFENEE